MLGLLAVVLALHAPCPQTIVVQAASRASTHATLRLESCGTTAAGPWPARVGRSGLSPSHREGDGTTPLGTFRIGPVVYGVAADPGVHLAYHRLVCGDWWDEDPASPTYNTFRHVPCGARPPFGGGSEALWTITGAYRYFAVVRYNDAPAVPARGSAIFLHVDTGRATNGCVSLPLGRLVTLLRLLRPGASIRVSTG
jgi:L,D-peptidoglycan transpeptidase YkuD (ErfK/YbiS/YcfS/YnhG family)